VDSLSYKTKFQNVATVDKKWVLVDADAQVLGRLSSQVAAIIRGKNKPGFTPHVDGGDNVIVINADKVKLTGKKWDQKTYTRYSGYPGGQKSLTAKQVKARSSARIIEAAVRGMLPKNRLGRAIFNNLHVYEGAEHPHEAQKPKQIKLQS
jgi:large subunit ribosomal protein L13